MGDLVSQRGGLRPPVGVGDDQRRRPRSAAAGSRSGLPRRRRSSTRAVAWVSVSGAIAIPSHMNRLRRLLIPANPYRCWPPGVVTLPGVVGDGDDPAHDLRALVRPRARDQQPDQRAQRVQDERRGELHRPRERAQHGVPDPAEDAAEDRRLSRPPDAGRPPAPRSAPRAVTTTTAATTVARLTPARGAEHGAAACRRLVQDGGADDDQHHEPAGDPEHVLGGSLGAEDHQPGDDRDRQSDTGDRSASSSWPAAYGSAWRARCRRPARRR